MLFLAQYYMGQINFFWISKISRKMKGHWFCDQYMTIQMKYHFVCNSKKCSRLGNRNMRLLFLLPLPIISYSRAVSSSPCYSIHKWVLVGKTWSAKWLLPAALWAELTVQKCYSLCVCPLLTLSRGSEDVLHSSWERAHEKKPLRNSKDHELGPLPCLCV